VHEAADRHEAALRVRFVRAMKKLQADTSITELGAMLALGHGRAVGAMHVPKAKITATLEPVKTVVKSAVRRGGRLGADQLNNILRSQRA
jgi:hypothetical protein